MSTATAGTPAADGGAAPAPGGTPAPDPTAAAAATAAAAGQADGGGSPPSGAYRPEGLPDHLYGANDKETLDKVWKMASGFRDRAAVLEAPPKDAAGYEPKWSEKVAPYLGDLSDDKFVQGLRGEALKSGLNNAQFSGFLSGAMELMLDLDLVEKPVDPAVELAKMIPADALNLPKADQDAAVQRRISTNLLYIDGLVADGLDKNAAESLKAELAGYPELHQLVELMRGGAGAKPALGGSAPAAVTADTLNARTADPRNQWGNAKFDKSFAAETTRMFQMVHGEGEGRN
jgi:hypothetical protein